MKYFDEFIKDLSSLISFKSVQGESTPNAPFGKEVKKALDCFLSIGKRFNLKTQNYDNYVGEISLGKGEEIGIIGHLDVVPEGNGWNTDPFTLTEKKGVYYGRGISDDKAPLLMCLYALRELKESGQPLNKKFRLFCGTNEETGWQDAKYLTDKNLLPEKGFSPDGNFPVSYAEKGITVLTFKIPALKNFYGVKGGTAINAVCGEAECCAFEKGIDEKKLFDNGLYLKDGNRIVSIGKSCHGSTPHLGKNALKPLFNYFLSSGEKVQNVVDCIFCDKYKISEMENEQGKVTLSPDLIEEKDGYIYISCDMRIPAPFTFDDVKKKIDGFNIEYTFSQKHPPFMVNKNGDFIQTLLKAYNGVMNTSSTPLSLGGSTFGRVFKEGCAFGAELENFDGHIHEPNECMSYKAMNKIYEIYRSAIFELNK